MHSMFVKIQKNSGSIFLIAFFLIILKILQFASSWLLINNEKVNILQNDAIRQVSQERMKYGDIVFLSSKISDIKQELESLGVQLQEFNPTNTIDFQSKLMNVIDGYCSSNYEKTKPAVYFIWTEDNDQTVFEISKAVRSLNFYFVFEALVPYEGSGAFTIDKILHLQPKENLIHYYCEVRDFSIDKQIMLIIDPSEFSPWIGAMETGRVSWLASDPTRTMFISDFEVRNFPPMISYDPYWSIVFDDGLSWTFKNQDSTAYKQVTQKIKNLGGIVMVEREAKLGFPAKTFLHECFDGQSLYESQHFHQMCLK